MRARSGAAMSSLLAHAGLAAALTAVLYSLGLAVSPPHLTHDEIKFALQAHSIAETGRDLNGRLLAVYFPEPGYQVGRDPVCIYLTAGVLSLLPLSEASIRFPSAIVGGLGVGLILVLARRLFDRPLTAWIVAGILALTPTYYIHSRVALSVIYPVPFVLAWLIALVAYSNEPRQSRAAACGAVLGAGVYSYLGAALMMPLYLVATIVVLAAKKDWRGARVVTIAFAIALIPLAVWQLTHPRYAEIVTAYHLFEPAPEHRGAIASIGAFVRQRVDTYWDSFDPGRLFFTGESSLQISTREVGSFVLPMAIFLGVGLRELVRRGPGTIGALLLFGLLSAPLPGIIMNDTEIRRWLLVTPFAALVAGFGVDAMLRSRPPVRLLAGVLVAAIAVQFFGFAGDYFGPYRERASVWFGGNIRAAVETALDEVGDRPASAYIASTIPWVEAYWRFYATARHQPALISRARYVRFDGGEAPAPTAGSVAVTPATDTSAAAELERAGWTRRHTIPDLDGRPSFFIYGPSGV